MIKNFNSHIVLSEGGVSPLDKTCLIRRSASGAVASLTDGADSLPVRKLVADIKPVQSGSGDPSPDNVRPISGWTGANLYKSGKNLWGGQRVVEGIQHSLKNVTVDTEAKTVTFGAAAAVNITNNFTYQLYGRFKANTKYTIILTGSNTSGNASNIRVFYGPGGYESFPAFGTTKETKVFVTNNAKSFISLYKSNAGGNTTLYYDECGIFEGDLTASDFVPYVGSVTPVSWETEAGTVYGGTLDVTTGVLTVDKALYTFTGEETFTEAVAESSVFYASVLTGHAVKTTVWSDRYVSTTITTASDMPNYSVRSNNSNSTTAVRCYFKNTDYTTPEAFAEAVAGTQVLYDLRNPVTYQLTPAEVKTLLGVNNIWADTGDIAVDYYADTTLTIEAIENMISALS